MLTIKLAWRNLFRNTRRTVLTCLLISFSLIALILTDGMILGMTGTEVNAENTSARLWAEITPVSLPPAMFSKTGRARS